jgi:hypothetical protein
MIRYFETTYHDSYEKKFENWNPLDTKTFQKQSVFAGNETGFRTAERIRINTKLISELYNGN